MKIPIFCFLTLSLVLLFLVGPFLILFLASFNDASLLQFPPRGFTLSWFRKIFEIQMFIDALKTSFFVGLASTFTGLLFGVPAAYSISRFNFWGKEALRLLFLSPAIVPGLVLGYALLIFFARIMRLPLLILLYFGHVILVFPYTIRITLSGLTNLDPAIDDAARSLGAAPWRVLMRIVLPNIRSSIIAAFILAFITSFNNVPVSLFLTGPGVSVLPIQMMAYVEYYFDPTIAALSSLLFLVTLLLVQVTERTLALSKYL
jgi:putative spermidine/putrescine transport system permease protein